MSLIVEAKNLVKKYESEVALNQISLDIETGTCFGLLGPNGAGKTTLLKLMNGMGVPSEGDLFVLGMSHKNSTREIKSRLGVVPQGDGLDPDLTVLENLVVAGAYQGLSSEQFTAACLNKLKWIGLEQKADSSIEHLSGGMRRRLALIKATLHEPQLLTLDEPTTSLDPVARQWAWDFIRQQKREGRSVVLTTHYMEEAEALCDRVALIYKGKIFEQGSPSDVTRRSWGVEIVDFEIDRGDASYHANRLREHEFEFQFLGSRLLVATDLRRPASLATSLVRGRSTTVRAPNLNDVFIKLVGGQLDSGESFENQ